MVRKFLYGMAFVVALLIAGAFVMALWADDLSRVAFVPDEPFTPQPVLETNAYADSAMWLTSPAGGDELARWQPKGATADATRLPYAVFFIHPTSYLDKAHWNGALDDETSQKRARLFVQAMASPFQSAETIWAPRYRQATFGAFMTDAPEAEAAIALAYRDVAQAFDAFVAATPPERPIVLVGHSQGALHTLLLLREKIAGTPLAARIAAAYVAGWPVSLTHDLPMLPLPACTAPDQPGCMMNWSSYAEPADPSMVFDLFAKSTGFDGQTRGDGAILCTNPLTGGAGTAAPASANLGTMVPDAALKDGELIAAAVPAHCSAQGLLLIGDPPELGPYVLPGNDYHVYDIPLFWANLRADVVRRVTAWQAAQ